MKSNITTLFLLVTILFSCNKSRNQKKILPANTGKQKEVILVMEDKLWKGNKGEILREIFEKEITGLPQSEKLFILIQINPKEFSRFFQTHKNIMFVSSDVKNSYSKNKWAKDQIVMYLNSDSKEIEFIESCRKTFSFFDRKELENIKYNYKKVHNKNARLYIKEQFGFELFLPTEYTVSLKKDGLFISDFIGMPFPKTLNNEFGFIIVSIEISIIPDKCSRVILQPHNASAKEIICSIYKSSPFRL